MFGTTRQRRHMRDRNRQYAERARKASRWDDSLHPATQTWRWMLRAAVLAGLGVLLLWSRGVALVHLDRQVADSDLPSRTLLDIHQAASALTPDNIEHWALSLSLEMQADRLLAPPGGDPRPRPFEIGLGEPALYIAYRLENEGFVTDAELFNLYLRVQFLDRYLEAGNYMLSETMTIPELAEALNVPSYEEELVTLLEGMRMEEFAEVLEANYIISAREFLDAVRDPRSMEIFDDYEFLADLPTNASLEGYLFPDTSASRERRSRGNGRGQVPGQLRPPAGRAGPDGRTSPDTPGSRGLGQHCRTGSRRGRGKALDCQRVSQPPLGTLPGRGPWPLPGIGSDSQYPLATPPTAGGLPSRWTITIACSPRTTRFEPGPAPLPPFQRRRNSARGRGIVGRSRPSRRTGRSRTLLPHHRGRRHARVCRHVCRAPAEHHPLWPLTLGWARRCHATTGSGAAAELPVGIQAKRPEFPPPGGLGQ